MFPENPSALNIVKIKLARRLSLISSAGTNKLSSIVSPGSWSGGLVENPLAKMLMSHLRKPLTAPVGSSGLYRTAHL